MLLQKQFYEMIMKMNEMKKMMTFALKVNKITQNRNVLKILTGIDKQAIKSIYTLK